MTIMSRTGMGIGTILSGRRILVLVGAGPMQPTHFNIFMENIILLIRDAFQLNPAVLAGKCDYELIKETAEHSVKATVMTECPHMMFLIVVDAAKRRHNPILCRAWDGDIVFTEKA